MFIFQYGYTYGKLVSAFRELVLSHVVVNFMIFVNGIPLPLAGIMNDEYEDSCISGSIKHDRGY